MALEDVTVPAGTFQAYKLELNSLHEAGSRVRLTTWFQPDRVFAIKSLREVIPRKGPAEREIYEMVGRRRGSG